MANTELLDDSSEKTFSGRELASELQLAPTESDYSARAHEIVDEIPRDAEGLAKYYFGDHDSAESFQSAIDQAEVMKPGARIAIRVGQPALDGILGDGRLKTYEETGERVMKYENDDYTKFRSAREKELGLRKAGEPPVVYGFLADKDTMSTAPIAEAYGPVAITLKPEVLERSTFTRGDSYENKNASPMSFEDALIRKQVVDRKNQSGTADARESKYVEAQVLGGVNLQDIEGILLTIGSEVRNNPGLETIENATSYIDKIKASAPDVHIAVQIPADDIFMTKQVLAAAERYPDVGFEGVLAAGSPAEASFKMAVSGEEEDRKANFIDRRVNQYEQAKARREVLNSKLEERWHELGHDGEPPQNVSIELINHDQRY